MEDDELSKYRQAGQILSRVLEEVRPMVQVGVTLMEVAMRAETAILENGGKPAFPCNISRDREAAHYTPGPNDNARFGEEMVKLDIGVHVDGYIADSAITVDLSGHPDLVESSKAALEAAIELVGPGVSTSTIGNAIEECITGYGYRPVGNLTGHGLLRYHAHAEPAIPNRGTDIGVFLEEGDVIAIEPFATDGIGRISESPVTEIFGFTARRPIRAPQARQLLRQIEETYSTLPFARRWLKCERMDFALNQLLRNGIIHRYPVLWEVEGALVSQAEHTLIVTADGCEVTTRPNL